MKIRLAFALAPILALLSPLLTAGPVATPPPNVVIIYADDLGYGDLGCFGAEDIATPHLDRLAVDGIKFTDFYSAAHVCSPSRAALLTGRIPQRMGIGGVFFPESFTGMPTDELTLAELLHNQGYATAAVGKWHLGHHHRYLPLQRGFDEYFGIPYSNDMESTVYLEGNDVVDFAPDQRFTTRTYTERAVDFIRRHPDGPFFLYLAHNMPHVPIYASPEFEGTSQRGLYGDVIQELDWSVGQIRAALEAQGLLENTLIVFSSDNGPWHVMRDHGGSAAHLREGKQFTFDGGMRVPTVAMWPAGIKAGQVYEAVAVMTDWMITIAALTGAELPTDRAYDGENLQPVFAGTGPRADNTFLFYDGMTLSGYREGDWKLKLPYAGFPGARWKHQVAPHPLLLVNLRDDPGEQHNLADAMPEKVAAMRTAMEAAHAAKGPFPPPLVLRSNADESHFDHLEETYGERFWEF
ncbi:sulfatase family protein [Actomonas aquatica]|uniref:Sulfatase n=1 Tax=Actomonas aquatica TaxID=2866162 RepID=A0ABZ1C2Q8_9BACT|nr:sulfatase [Opitutus sp. WL0086]WRQ85993.1 sulfatase [Opitutus sp. WL0086]